MKLLKRLIGVIAVAGGRPVQSLGYTRTLPLGRIECVFENLDRWEVDEVLVVAIDRSRLGLGPDYGLISRIAQLGLSTPLSYGGGISTVDQAMRAVTAGAERVCVDSLLHDAPDLVRGMEAEIGAQAIIAALPLAAGDNGVMWYDHRARTEGALSEGVLSLFADHIVSEILAVDWRHEGQFHGFDERILDGLDKVAHGVQQLAYGGLSEAAQIRSVLRRPNVMAACVGNFLNYREHAVQHFKIAVGLDSVRPPTFAGTVDA